MTPDNFISIANYVFIALFVAAALFWWFRFSLNRRWNKHRQATIDKWQADGVEFVKGPSGGQFGGLESGGAKRAITGIGLAVLTSKDLRVTRASPLAWWIVTYKQIKGVSLYRKFLGEVSKETPFIVVRFVKDGEPDKLAFRVKNYQEWAEELAEFAGVKLKDKTDE